ncbi:YIP1 family protein [Alteromonas sp. 009811495]|uniref:YIP1 family protein n=1 Tax=Alteromonas sp. 009811495 TaxID=3002962 RepID=UPI00237D332A|nr:YIP1 family protein [Alteromonas sp. 009811495]WDT87328.1 YIP1 family protein [Alteromonas sp. 009811495]
MHTVSNPFQACNDIFFKPNGVFKAVGENNNWSWMPFILVMGITLASQYLYVSFVDIEWFANLNIAAQGDMSPAEEEQMRAFFDRGTLLWSQLIGAFLVLIIINAVYAVYLNLATRSDDSHVFGFTDWYGFSWWLSMPYVLTGLIGVALLMFSGDHQVSPAIMAPTSLSFLLSVPMDSPWFAFTQAIRLELFWGIYLAMVGISQWTSFSRQKAAVVACAPYVIIYGIWIASLMLF